MKIIESPGSQIVSDPKHDQFGGRFFCTRGLTPLFLWNILRWSGRSHHIPHLQSYFRMGWNRSSILTSLMQSDSSFSFVEIHQGFLAKKTSVYLPIVDVKWPQQNMVPSAIQNTDNLWCFVSGPRPETVFVGWIKINLQYITDKLIGFIWFYKLEYPNHSLRASWSS